MDVRLLLGFLALALWGCSEKSESRQTILEIKPINCDASMIPNEYAVMWKSGKVEVIRAKSREEFMQNFVEPYIDQLWIVEENQILATKERRSLQPKNYDPINWGVEASQLQEVWDLGIRGQNVKIAVIDSGIDVEHPQLKNQIAINTAEIPENDIDDDQNGYTDDYYGYDFFSNSGRLEDLVSNATHGTHVSGIALAEHTEEDELLGVAPDSRLIAIKFIDDAGDTAAAVRGIDYAILRGAKVINASWGGPSCSKILEEKIASLESENILFVAAAGNDSQNLEDIGSYPAAFILNPLITVSAISRRIGPEGEPIYFTAGYSNYSETLSHIVAPGSSIYSSVPGGYSFLSGTSMASPHVAGAAALLWSHLPSASVLQIKQALIQSGESTNFRFPVAGGQLNMPEALRILENLVSEPALP